MSEVMHTPTPWVYDEYDGFIHDGNPETGALFECAALDHPVAVGNCRHVVRCVNSHAALVEALEAAAD